MPGDRPHFPVADSRTGPVNRSRYGRPAPKSLPTDRRRFTRRQAQRSSWRADMTSASPAGGGPHQDRSGDRTDVSRPTIRSPPPSPRGRSTIRPASVRSASRGVLDNGQAPSAPRHAGRSPATMRAFQFPDRLPATRSLFDGAVIAYDDAAVPRPSGAGSLHGGTLRTRNAGNLH